VYHVTYSKLIRHTLARTPLVNLVVQCERIPDIAIPNNVGNKGLALPDELTGQFSVSGPPAVVYALRAVPGLTVDPAVTAKLPSGVALQVNEFLDGFKDSGLADIVMGLPGHLEKLNQTRTKNLRVILLAYDVDVSSQMTRRVLLNHAKSTSPATVVLMTQEPIDDMLLRTYMPVVTAERPSQIELSQLFQMQLTKLDAEHSVCFTVNGSTDPTGIDMAAEACAYSLAGLYAPTALQVLSLHLTGRLAKRDLNGKTHVCDIDSHALSNEKAQILNQDGYVSLIQQLVSPEDIGGLEEFKRWLVLRKAGFDPAASEACLRYPKGVLLVGPPGTAKSMCAKLVAYTFDMPLIRLDVGALFNSHLGNSERNLRNALSVAEASAPCVLFIDELEKSMGGGNSESDGGTSSRIRGTLLTWLSDKTAPVFIVGTANNIVGLPPEMTRRGRIDEVFHVDLPNLRERKSIWKIHLKKVKQLHNLEANLDVLANLTTGFSGAEIEQAVHDALYDHYQPGKPLVLTEAAMRETLLPMHSLSEARAEDIKKLQTWAKLNARPASLPDVAPILEQQANGDENTESMIV